MPKKQASDDSSAFKNWINPQLVSRMGESLKRVDPHFDLAQFRKVSGRLKDFELKDRVRLLRDQLYQQLPKEFPLALSLLLKSFRDQTLKGFDLWPYTEFIQTYGLEYETISLKALSEITTRFTGEFAVRPFIAKSPTTALEFLRQCAQSSDVHLRRLASEGSRPLLPWGEKLKLLIQEPSLTLPILELLKWDEELYVRKSVANHLNDISKHQPELVLKILKTWEKRARSPEEKQRTQWILRHSLRTLIKKGHPKALSLMGVGTQPKIKVSPMKLKRSSYKINDRIEFEIQIQSALNKPQKMVVDYLIHYQKSNGSTQPKVFKLKTFELGPAEKRSIKKIHHLKQVTTRKHYPGVHYLEIQINGQLFTKVKWHLK